MIGCMVNQIVKLEFRNNFEKTSIFTLRNECHRNSNCLNKLKDRHLKKRKYSFPTVYLSFSCKFECNN